MISGTNNNVVDAVVENGVAVETKVNLDKDVFKPAVIEQTRNSCNLAEMREKYVAELVSSGAIDNLTSEINIADTTSIIEFGKKPAEEISKVADGVLANYDTSNIDSVSNLVNNLISLMKKIDMKEIDEVSALIAKQAKKSFLDKFRESATQKLEKILGKYRGVQSEMDGICAELTKYEMQIKQSNKDIQKMYEASIQQYKKLILYVAAGEQAIKEIEEYRDNKQKELEETGNTDLQFEVQNVNQALTLMEQRTADLRAAEAVALQSIPTYKIQEYSNANLSRKINSAFIVTIPAFKNSLAQAVISKQQAIQAQGLSALDAVTNELVKQNAQNAVNQLAASQKLANSSAISADTIEQSWETIMNGIQQYKEMEAQYREVRKDEAKRIEAANAAYLDRLAKGEAI